MSKFLATFKVNVNTMIRLNAPSILAETSF